MKICIAIGEISYRIDCGLLQDTAKFAPYLCADTAQCVELTVTEEDVLRERVRSGENLLDPIQSAILRKIAQHSLMHNRLLMHGACIAYGGKGYIFVAPSGTGKTTHVKLWQRMLGERAAIVNGDKPILSLGEEILAFGTPWNGKENLGSPGAVPLAAIAELRQAEENSISPMKKADAFSCLYRQSYMLGADAELQSRIIAVVRTLIDRIPVYQLRCNMEEAAFTCAFETLTGERRT